MEIALNRPEAVLIAGPTASGKSALALELAARLDGVIVNADAMQVYRELRVISARPSPADEARVPHALYGIASVQEPFSVGRWAQAVGEALPAIRARGQVPVIVGGTGLYFAALLNGLSPIPEIHPTIRAEARLKLAELGNERFHALLSARDPVMGRRLEVGDSQRLVRAWEVIEATGQSLDEWQKLKGTPVLSGMQARFVLKPNRDWLKMQIARRFERMMTEGALEEVRALGVIDDALPAARALGVPQLLAHLRGEMALDVAFERAVTETRQYAKRQMTWFRNQMQDWVVVEGGSPDALFACVTDRINHAC
jgi:tRNA dimethylallyltransferase